MQQLRVSYTAGVTAGKWMDRFTERYPRAELQASRHDAGNILDLLASGQADVVFVRFPIGASPKDATRHVIPLYDELEVICAAKDHEVEYYEESIPASEAEQFTELDLTDYPEESGGLAMAMEVVSTGSFVARMPMSVARLFARKDVVVRTIEGGQRSTVGIAWRADVEQNELIEEFIGIVRGRSASSSRQASVRKSEQESARKRESSPRRAPRAARPESRNARAKPRKRR